MQLIDEGNTIPFIARYRKEATGALERREPCGIFTRDCSICATWKRKKDTGAPDHRGAGKTDAGASQEDYAEAVTLVAVDDLYRPYRPEETDPRHDRQGKRAGASGQIIILLQKTGKKLSGRKQLAYVDPEKGVETVRDAIAGCHAISSPSRWQTVPITARASGTGR